MPVLLYINGIPMESSLKNHQPINLTGEKSFAKQQLGTPDRGDSRILGLPWNKRDDEISVVFSKEKATATKRGILRKLVKTYDHLGFYYYFYYYYYYIIEHFLVTWMVKLQRFLQ